MVKPKVCINCKKEYTPGSRNYKRAKFCSSACSLKTWRRNNPEHNKRIKMEWRRKHGVLRRGSPEHREAVSRQLKGTTLSDETKERISGSALRGSIHHAWKGEYVSYRALHKWVERYLGKPGDCIDCGASGLSGRKIHWSNVSGKYRRDLSDWQRLCAKCHKAYDSRLKERVEVL